MVKAAEMGARRSGEKASGFAVTCNLLSQYLKERGGLRDLGLGVSAAAAPALPLAEARGKQEVPKTMNLLPGVETEVGDLDGGAVTGGVVFDRRKDPAVSMDLFPQHAGLGPADEENPDLMREAQRGQMTIFYGGKVMVFDNFPAERARELMAMAGRGCPSPALPSEQPPPAQPAAASAAVASEYCEAKPAAPTAAVAPPAVSAQDSPKKPTKPAASDLPIARRASLHRFLEKRKDRISAKAPYPVSGSPSPFASSPVKPEEERRGQWLGLAPHACEKV